MKNTNIPEWLIQSLDKQPYNSNEYDWFQENCPHRLYIPPVSDLLQLEPSILQNSLLRIENRAHRIMERSIKNPHKRSLGTREYAILTEIRYWRQQIQSILTGIIQNHPHLQKLLEEIEKCQNSSFSLETSELEKPKP